MNKSDLIQNVIEYEEVEEIVNTLIKKNILDTMVSIMDLLKAYTYDRSIDRSIEDFFKEKFIRFREVVHDVT